MKNRNHCGCGRSSCSSCCPKGKKQGPPVPPCGCPQAFDNAFIRSVEDAIVAGSVNGAGVGPATALADLFCPDGCFEFFPGGAPRCGREALIAGFLADQAVLGSLEFGITSIERLVNPDCSVTVTVGHTSRFQIIGGPLLCSFDYDIITFDPSCCIRRILGVNVDVAVCAPGEPSPALTARSAPLHERARRLTR